MKEKKQSTNQSKSIDYDVVIIGGGINGGGIARELAIQGISVALFEQGDFAQGTSSASSKLVHGGLRYLETFDVKLVKEALMERYLLLKNAPDFVKIMPFAVPIYPGLSRPSWKVYCGLKLYRWLEGRFHLGEFEWLNKNQTLNRYPWLSAHNLSGCGIYHDAKMDDARLCIETILQAETLGAVVSNYSKVTSVVPKSGYAVVTTVDEFTQQETTHSARIVINTVGPWLNSFLNNATSVRGQFIRSSKGSHIVINKVFGPTAFLIQAPQDKRVMFVIPRDDGESSLVGTTELATSMNPEDVTISPSEINYLIRALNEYFPKKKVASSHVLSAFSGIRPLINPGKKSIGKISREHSLVQHDETIMSLIGGKYTTYRSVSESVARTVISQLKKKWCDSVSTRDLTLSTITLDSSIDHAINHTHAKRAIDYVRRRTPLMLNGQLDSNKIDTVITTFTDHFNWTNKRQAEERSLIQNELTKAISPYKLSKK